MCSCPLFFKHYETSIFTLDGTSFRIVLYYKPTKLARFLLKGKVRQFERHFIGRRNRWIEVGHQHPCSFYMERKLNIELLHFKREQAIKYRNTLLKFKRKR